MALDEKGPKMTWENKALFSILSPGRKKLFSVKICFFVKNADFLKNTFPAKCFSKNLKSCFFILFKCLGTRNGEIDQ